jgi:hypothetical protein
MKALLLLGVLAVVCVVLFVVGVFSPRRSRRMQEGVDRLTRTGERKSDQKAGRFGDATERGLRLMRKAADRSARKGRDAHQKLTS